MRHFRNKNMLQALRAATFCLVMGMLAAGCKNEMDTLQSLKDELAQTGDTLIGYSLKEHYAMWIHEDKPMSAEGEIPDAGMQSLYICDLSNGERTRIFTTNKDSVTLNPYADKQVCLESITAWRFTPDSLALIIEDGYNGRYFYTYMLPVKGKELFDLGVDGIPDDQVLKSGKIPVKETGYLFETEDYDDGMEGLTTGWSYLRNYCYNTQGELLSSDDSISVFPDDPGCTMFNTEFRAHAGMEESPEKLKIELYRNSAYRIGDVERIAKNEVKFERTFKGTFRLFELKVESMQLVNDLDRWDGQGNPAKRYRLDGENFSIYTDDDRAADVDYPSWVIIAAQAHDIRHLGYNPFAGMLMGVFNAQGAGFNEDAEFTFAKAHMIYSE